MSLIFVLIFIFNSIEFGLCSVLKSEKPIVIAHRGASGYLPEHTFQAKTLAYSMGSDYLEQDLVLTKDNIPIVLHDIYLDTVTDIANSTEFKSRNRTDGRYYAIDFTLAEIKTLKVSERFSEKPPNTAYYPQRFPKWFSKFEISSFKEEIGLVKGLEKSFKQSANFKNKIVGIYPEIKQPEFHKNEGRKNFSEIVLQVLRDYNYTKSTDPIFLQCFDPFELMRIRSELKSELTMIQLIDTESDGKINYTYWGSEEGLKNISTFAQGIGPDKSLLIDLDSTKTKYLRPSEMSINAKKLNLAIHPYTFRVDSLPSYVNNHDELMDIFIHHVKVDGLFSDFPDVVVEYVKNNGDRLLSKSFFLTISIFKIFY
jgi:glycerophosphoryl diester phosphodiesterase